MFQTTSKISEPLNENSFIAAYDNGSTGMFCIADFCDYLMKVTLYKPLKRTERNIVTKKGNISRLDRGAYKTLLKNLPTESTLHVFEKPFTNSRLSTISVPSGRYWEAQLCCLEDVGHEKIEIVSSNEWQNKFLGKA